MAELRGSGPVDPLGTRSARPSVRVMALSMEPVVLYGVGSPIVADVEVTLLRAGRAIAAGVRNVPGDAWMVDREKLVEAAELPPTLFRLPFLIPLLTPGHRHRAQAEASAVGFRNPLVLVDPASVVPPGWTPGPGTYVNGGCTVGAACAFGDFVFVNRGACIGHHVVLGPFVSVGPGAVIAGQVEIGTGAFIGAGAVVLPSLRIGANAVVAAGAVLSQDVPDHALAAGNPARIIRTGIAGYQDVAVA